MTPDAGPRRIAVDRLPVGARAGASALLLQVYREPPTAIPTGVGGYGFDYHETVYRLPYAALAGDRVVVGEHDRTAFEPEPPYLSWLSPDEPGWPVDGRTWRAGRLMQDTDHDREIAAAAYAADGTELLRVPLGRGHVIAGRPAHGRLWFVLARRDGAHEVVAVDPATGTTVVARAGIDITDRCWALPASPPPDAGPYAEDRLRSFGEVWREGFADMVDVDVALVEAWPESAVQVTFRHRWFPCGLLRRRVPLFDEPGRPADVEYCDIHLMEDLATGQLPPVTEAVDGVLHI